MDKARVKGVESSWVMKTFIVPQSTQKNYSVTQLANRHWFCVFCTLSDSDIRLHSGQNDVDSRGAAV